MAGERSYTLEEIETRTGFDKRTIAYYVQEELLPRVGRRGPRTRYPQSYLDRLLFIRMIRDQQDRGRLGSLTLSDIRDILRYLTEEEISDVVEQRDTLDLSAFESEAGGADETMAPPHHRMSRLREVQALRGDETDPPVELMEYAKTSESVDDRDGSIVLEMDDGPPMLELREVAADDEVGSMPLPPANAPQPRRERLGALLARLGEHTGATRRRGSEHWTRANVTADITLSARNIDEEGAELLEAVARSLRWKLLRSRRQSRK